MPGERCGKALDIPGPTRVLPDLGRVTLALLVSLDSQDETAVSWAQPPQGLS